MRVSTAVTPRRSSAIQQKAAGLASGVRRQRADGQYRLAAVDHLLEKSMLDHDGR
jgi:hypothetical protein